MSSPEILKEQTNYQVAYPTDAEQIDPAFLKTFANRNPHQNSEIEIHCPEFTSLCPMTGLPDFGTIYIKYTPDKQCIELKSLKYYLLQFRNAGIFYENVVNKILRTLVEALDPIEIEVKGEFSNRGGINSIITAKHIQLK
jgi:7-cyano-7-deazaguanine reductase